MCGFEENTIENINGHYEAFYNGEFICSGDTYNECLKEAQEYIESYASEVKPYKENKY